MINKLKQWTKNIAKDIGLKLLEISGENYGPVLYEKNKSLAAIIPPQNFKPKKSLLSKNEKKLFVELCKAYKNDGYVFPEFCFEKLVKSNNNNQDRYIYLN